MYRLHQARFHRPALASRTELTGSLPLTLASDDVGESKFVPQFFSSPSLLPSLLKMTESYYIGVDVYDNAPCSEEWDPAHISPLPAEPVRLVLPLWPTTASSPALGKSPSRAHRSTFAGTIVAESSYNVRSPRLTPHPTHADPSVPPRSCALFTRNRPQPSEMTTTATYLSKAPPRVRQQELARALQDREAKPTR